MRDDEKKRRRKEIEAALRAGGADAERIIGGIGNEETREKAQELYAGIAQKDKARSTIAGGEDGALEMIRGMKTPEKRDQALKLYTTMTHDKKGELYNKDARTYNQVTSAWEKEETAKRKQLANQEKIRAQQRVEKNKAKIDRLMVEGPERRRQNAQDAYKRSAGALEAGAGAPVGTSPLDMLGHIDNIQDEQVRGDTLRTYFENMGNVRSPYYNPYIAGSSNDYAKKMFGVDEFTDEWVLQNRGYLADLERDEKGEIKKPGASATDAQKKAYAYAIVAGDVTGTREAQEQAAALYEDIAAAAATKGFDAGEYVEAIDWAEYPTLKKMLDGAQTGTPYRLNYAVPFSMESLYGAAYAAQNGIEVQDPREYVALAGKYVNAQKQAEIEAANAPAPKGLLDDAWAAVAEWWGNVTGGGQGGNKDAATPSEARTPEERGAQDEQAYVNEPSDMPPAPEEAPENEPQEADRSEANSDATPTHTPETETDGEQKAEQKPDEERFLTGSVRKLTKQIGVTQEPETRTTGIYGMYTPEKASESQKRDAFRRGDYAFIESLDDQRALRELDKQIETQDAMIEVARDAYNNARGAEAKTKYAELEKLEANRRNLNLQRAKIAFPDEATQAEIEMSVATRESQNVPVPQNWSYGRGKLNQLITEEEALHDAYVQTLDDITARMYETGGSGRAYWELDEEQKQAERQYKDALKANQRKRSIIETHLPQDDQAREIRKTADTAWLDMLYEREIALSDGDDERVDALNAQMREAGYETRWPEEIAAAQAAEDAMVAFSMEQGDDVVREKLHITNGRELTRDDYLKAAKTGKSIGEWAIWDITQATQKMQGIQNEKYEAFMEVAKRGDKGEINAFLLDAPNRSEEILNDIADVYIGEGGGFEQRESFKDIMSLPSAVYSGALQGPLEVVSGGVYMPANLYYTLNAPKYGNCSPEQFRALDETYDMMCDIQDAVNGLQKAADIDVTGRAGYVQGLKRIASELSTNYALAGGGSAVGNIVYRNALANLPAAASLPEVIDKAEKLYKGTAKLISGAGFFARGYKSCAEEALASGATQEQAALYGLVGATVSAFVENLNEVEMMAKGYIFGPNAAGLTDDMIEGVKIYGKAQRWGTQGGIKAFFAAIHEAGMGEAMEELYEAPLQGLAQKAIYDRAKPWMGQGGVVDPQGMAQSAAMGYVVGGIMGGASYAGQAGAQEGASWPNPANAQTNTEAETQTKPTETEVEPEVGADSSNRAVDPGDDVWFGDEQSPTRTPRAEQAGRTEGSEATSGAQFGESEANGNMPTRTPAAQPTGRIEDIAVAAAAMGGELYSRRTKEIAEKLMGEAIEAPDGAPEWMRAGLAESMVSDAIEAETGAEAAQLRAEAEDAQTAAEQARAYTEGLGQRVQAVTKNVDAWGSEVAENPTEGSVSQYKQAITEQTRLMREEAAAEANTGLQEQKAEAARAAAEQAEADAKARKGAAQQAFWQLQADIKALPADQAMTWYAQLKRNMDAEGLEAGIARTQAELQEVRSRQAQAEEQEKPSQSATLTAPPEGEPLGNAMREAVAANWTDGAERSAADVRAMLGETITPTVEKWLHNQYEKGAGKGKQVKREALEAFIERDAQTMRENAKDREAFERELQGKRVAVLQPQAVAPENAMREGETLRGYIKRVLFGDGSSTTIRNTETGAEVVVNTNSVRESEAKMSRAGVPKSIRKLAMENMESLMHDAIYLGSHVDYTGDGKDVHYFASALQIGNDLERVIFQVHESYDNKNRLYLETVDVVNRQKNKAPENPRHPQGDITPAITPGDLTSENSSDTLSITDLLSNYNREHIKKYPLWAGRGQEEDATPKGKIQRVIESNIPVEQMNPREIRVDPEAYQFKSNTDESGTTGTLKNVESYKPTLAGALLVHERTDGTRYVVNGHHRLELAQRTGTPSVNVTVIREADGVTVKDARAIGAIMNISEGRGTAVDAAKILREYDFDARAMRDLGVSMRENVAGKGLALSALSDDLFAGVVNGSISQAAGIAAGETFSDAAQQRAFIASLGKAGLKGAGLEKLRAYAAQLRGETASAVISNQVSWLDDDVAFVEAERKASIAIGLQRALRDQKSVFAKVGKERSAQILRGAGMEIDTEAARSGAQLAQAAAQIVQQQAALAGTRVNQIVREAAGKMQSGTSLQEATADASKQIVNLVKTGEIFNEADGSGRDRTEVAGGGQEGAGGGSAEGQTAFLKRQRAASKETGTKTGKAGAIKSEQAIIEGLRKAIPGITVRRQSNRQDVMDAGAMYDAKTGGVRVSGNQSLLATVHEIGHKAAIEAGILTDVERDAYGKVVRVDVRPEAQGAIDAMVRRMTEAEIGPYRSSAGTLDMREARQEALAVFWERWMEGDDAAREFAGPLTDQLMRGLTRKQLSAMQQARADYQARALAELAEQIGADTRTRSDLEKGKKIPTIGQVITGIFDEYYEAIGFDRASVESMRKGMTAQAWRQYVKSARKGGRQLIDAEDRLYLKLQALYGTNGTANYLLKTEAVSPSGQRLEGVKSLAQALTNVPNTQAARKELNAYIALWQEMDARNLAARRKAEAEAAGEAWNPDDATGGVYMSQYKHLSDAQLEAEIKRLEALRTTTDGKSVYKAALDDMVRLHEKLMRTWVIDTGAAGITAEQYDKVIEARPHYVPTHAGGDIGIDERGQSGTMIKSEAQIRNARSGDADIVDYVQAFVEDTRSIVRKSREMAAKQTMARAYDRYDGHAAHMREISLEDNAAWAQAYAQMRDQIQQNGVFDIAQADSNVITTMLNAGVNAEAGRVIVVHEPTSGGDVRTRYFEITDQALYDMMSRPAIPQDALSGMAVGKAMQKINEVFRSTTTLMNPFFGAKNAVRDAMTAAVFGNQKNGKDALSAWMQAVGEITAYHVKGEVKSDAMRQYAALGGLGGDAYMHGAEGEAELFADLLSAQDWDAKKIESFAKRIAAKGTGAISKFNDIIEGAQRYAQFVEGTRAGQSAIQAFNRAMENTTNFSRRGASQAVRNIGKYFYFFNASLQGTYDVLHAVQEGKNFDPKRMSDLLRRGVAVAFAAPLAEALLRALTWDEEDRKKYDALADNVKAENMVLYFIGSKAIMVPKGQSPLFAVGDLMGRRIAAGIDREQRSGGDVISYMRHELGDDMAAGMLELVDGLNPMQSSVFQTAIDISRNENHWNEPIVPERMMGWEKQNQTDAYTSVVANWIGGLTGQSPKMIHYAIDQQLGFVGDIILNMTTPGKGYMTETMSGNVAGFARMIGDMFIKGFTSKASIASSAYGDYQEHKEFYTDMLKEYEAVDGDRRKMRGKISTTLTDREFVKAVQDAERMKDYLSATQSAINKLYKKQDAHPERAEEYTDAIVLLEMEAAQVSEAWMRRYQAGDMSVAVKIPKYKK